MAQRLRALTNLGRCAVLIDKTIKTCGFSSEINDKLRELNKQLDKVIFQIQVSEFKIKEDDKNV